MQRIFLLLLAASLGISIFVCSQQALHKPISDAEIDQVIPREIQPFYYVALPFQGPYGNEELARNRFFQELTKQKVPLREQSRLIKKWLRSVKTTTDAQLLKFFLDHLTAKAAALVLNDHRAALRKKGVIE